MKFPHGVPMHTIPFLPLLSWLLSKLQIPERKRLHAVAYALYSIMAFTCFSLLQTFTGRSRFEFWWVSAAFVVATVTMMLASIGAGFSPAVTALNRRRTTI